jgi:hypothetical protein
MDEGIAEDLVFEHEEGPDLGSFLEEDDDDRADGGG